MTQRATTTATIIWSLLVWGRAKGWIVYGMDSKLKLGDQLKTSEQSEKLGDMII